MPSIVTLLCGGPPSWSPDPSTLRTQCLLSTLVIVMPLSLFKQLSALRYIAPIALVGLLYTAAVMMIECPWLYSHRVGKDGYGEVNMFSLDRDFFQCFSISIFAFNCHLNVVPVAQELQSPSDRRIAKTTLRVALVQLVFYVFISIPGYLSFLAATPQNVVKGYPGNDMAILVSRVMLSITILVGIPTNVLPTVRSMLCILELPFPSLGLEPSQFQVDEANGTQPLVVRRYPLNRTGVRHLLAILCIIGEVSIAIAVEDVALVVGILGASVGTLMMMVVPLLLVQVGIPDLVAPRQKWIITVAFVVSMICTLATLFVK